MRNYAKKLVSLFSSTRKDSFFIDEEDYLSLRCLDFKIIYFGRNEFHIYSCDPL